MARFNSIRALVSQTWSLSAWTISLYSYQTSCPCLHPLEASFCVWVCPGAPCSSIHTSWHFPLTFSLSGMHHFWVPRSFKKRELTATATFSAGAVEALRIRRAPRYRKHAELFTFPTERKQPRKVWDLCPSEAACWTDNSSKLLPVQTDSLLHLFFIKQTRLSYTVMKKNFSFQRMFQNSFIILTKLYRFFQM